MANTTGLQNFQSSWQQTATWAQQKGIKYNQYYPVYQQDTQRFLQYGANGTMSQAERERAIVAASNVGKATQPTPSTAPNPSNIIGNFETDARNIFTGLTGIVAHPLHNGLVDSVKNTWDLVTGSHHLTGGTDAAKLGDLLTSTVASWLPGTMDLGNVLKADPNISNPWQYVTSKKGFDYLAEHPISSALDIAPLTKAGLWVRDPERVANLAKAAGMTPDEFAKAGPIRLTRKFILNRDTGKVGPKGQALTVGDLVNRTMGKTFIHSNPAIADSMEGYEKTLNHVTSVNQALDRDLVEATSHLTSPDQWVQFHDITERAQMPGGLDAALQGVDDPRVLAAVRAWEERNTWDIENSLSAQGGPRIITDPKTGREGIYSLGGHPQVIRTSEAAAAAERDLLEVLGNKAAPLLEKTDQAGQFVEQHTNALEQAANLARQKTVAGQVPIMLAKDVRHAGPIRSHIPGYQTVQQAFTWPTRFSKDRIAKDLVDTGAWVPRLVEKVRQGDFETALKLTRSTAARLRKWDADRMNVKDPEVDPAFLEVRNQVIQLYKSLKALIEARHQGSKLAYKSTEEWTKEKPYRDSRHETASKTLEKSQKDEITKLRNNHRLRMAELIKAYRLKRAEIIKRYAKARSDREHTITDGTTNINERYALAKRELRTRHLLARQTHQELVRTRAAQGLSESPEIAPGAAGSPEAIQAGLDTLEAARKREVADLVASLPSKAELTAKQEAERNALRLDEEQKSRAMEQAAARDRAALEKSQKDARDRLEAENIGRRKRDGELSEKFDRYIQAQNDFDRALWEKPSDNLQPLWTNLFVHHLVTDARMKDSLVYKGRTLRNEHNWDEKAVEDFHANPHLMSALTQMGLKETLDDPVFNDLDQAIIETAKREAYENIWNMMKDPKVGVPLWVHHVSSEQIENNESGSAGLRFIVGHGIPKPNVLKPRTWGLGSSKFDAMAAVNIPQRDFLRNAGLQSFVRNYLDHHIVTAEDIQKTMLDHFDEDLRGITNQDEVLDLIKSKAIGWNLTAFDPESAIGFRLPRWKEGATYIDKDLLRAVEKISQNKGVFRGTPIEKATKLFRYSILGLSPRYTAHIWVGGTFLLALHEPLFFLKIPQMLDAFRTGQVPEDWMATPTNLGTTEARMLSKSKALQMHGTQGGKDTAHYLGQEWHAVRGLDWRKANPFTWLRALADVNYDLTTTAVHMQRALAGFAAVERAEKRGYFYDQAGNKIEMTQERAIYEGMKNAQHVFGDLRRMSPFERDVARTLMPFYGWNKHILQFVMKYPADHPWRAMMLANMAEFDTANTPGGLPARYQFLFFLGTPDAQGNVTAVDVRAANPLRDVANFATAGGLISSLNPVITAGAAYIDPQIIYGGNTLYPNLTYDQFYGVKEAGPQGTILTAAQQIVPELGSIQTAMQLASQQRGMNDSQLVKSIGNQLNIPWIPQQVNLRQEAARTAIDQYQVTKTLAANAWQTGNFSAIADLGSVPDPRNADYETPVTDLQQIYETLSKAYPGIPPSETAQPLPALHL